MPEFFHLLGRAKSVKYVSASRINACEEPEPHGAGSGDGVRFGPSSLHYLKGWSGLELSLTCRQGAFADNLSEEGMQTKRQGQGDKQMPPFAGCIQTSIRTPAAD